MQNWIQKYKSYLEPKSIDLIKKCLTISCVTCFVGVVILLIYNIYYISHYLYEASFIIFRTGIMIGLFPMAFAVVIGKWKKEH